MNGKVSPTTPSRTGALLLAAGGSSRLGEPKQRLRHPDGRTLVRRAAEEALAASTWPVVVVLGAYAAEVANDLAGLSLLLVENPAWRDGMGTSLATGMRALLEAAPETETVLVALCDQPGFSAAAVRALLEAKSVLGKPIAAAAYAGRLGAPAAFDRALFGELQQLRGDAGARFLIASDPARVASVPLPELALDLDTPEAVERWRRAPGARAT